MKVGDNPETNMFINALSVNNVTVNTVLVQQPGVSGILGMGPLSPIWTAFTDAATQSVTYQVSFHTYSSTTPVEQRDSMI